MIRKRPSIYLFLFFFFNDTATTEIYTLSLHDALPIPCRRACRNGRRATPRTRPDPRSEEHTSELQSRLHLVCRLLLEKKKKTNICIASLIQKKKLGKAATKYNQI